MGDEPLGVPLAPLNRLSAGNANPIAGAAARAICPYFSGEPSYSCQQELE